MYKSMKRWQIILIAMIAFLGISVAVGYRLGVQLLQGKVVDALGPGSRVTQLKVNWFTIELFGLSIDGPKGWPTAHTLEAERVTIVPDLRSLFSKRVRISSITFEKPYLSMLRTSGKLVMVPSLTESDNSQKNKSSDQTNASRAVTISTIELKDGSVDFYDATVTRPPLRTQFIRIEAKIQDVAVPAAEETRFDITGIIKGVRRDGEVKVNGWVGPGARDSSSRVVLAAADMVALQPYLVKSNEIRVTKGSVDLNLASEVRNRKLDGNGRIVLKDLELAPARGIFETFMGLPRGTMINFLKDHNNAIDIDFVLKGDTSHPNFALNENLSTRIATAMAGQLGKSVAEGLGALGRKGMEEAGDVVEGVGSAVKRLFGGR